MSTQKPFRVGIIGYGLSAKVFHIPFIKFVPDFELYAIVQRSPKPDDDAAKDWPGVKIYRSAEELVGDKAVDLVVVTTAPVSHFELAKMAMEKEKNVLVEKPLTPTEREARELVGLAKEKGVVLTVYQNRRFDSDFLTLKKVMGEGKLGRIVEFETHFDRHRPEPPTGGWKSVQAEGTGAVYDLGSHLIDQVVCLFGRPMRVTGFVGAQRVGGGGLEDSCTVMLHYDGKDGGKEGGLLVTVKAGVVSLEEKQLRYWIRGTEGTWRKEGLDPQEDQLRKQGMGLEDKRYAVEGEESWGQLTRMEDGNVIRTRVETVAPATYAEFYKRLAKAMKGDKDLVPVDPEQAALVIRLLELARESSRTGRTMDV
jgi:predicted dehydrogenase